MYITIDRNPELGYETQDEVCRKYGIIIYIRLVKTSYDDEANSINEDEDAVMHVIKIILNLVSPWAFRNISVCTDYHFASAVASEYLKYIELCFVGFLNTATKTFPLQYLYNI